MIYRAKIYTGAVDGEIKDLAGAVLVFADSEPDAYDKAKDHWEGFIKSEGFLGGNLALTVSLLDVEAIIP